MKISKEEIRKRLQQKEEKIDAKPEQKKRGKTRSKQPEKEKVLIKDLKKLGITIAIIATLLIASIIIREQTDLFSRLADTFFRLGHLS